MEGKAGSLLLDSAHCSQSAVHPLLPFWGFKSPQRDWVPPSGGDPGYHGLCLILSPRDPLRDIGA